MKLGSRIRFYIISGRVASNWLIHKSALTSVATNASCRVCNTYRCILLLRFCSSALWLVGHRHICDGARRRRHHCHHQIPSRVVALLPAVRHRDLLRLPRGSNHHHAAAAAGRHLLRDIRCRGATHEWGGHGHGCHCDSFSDCVCSVVEWCFLLLEFVC